ncbi:hypothetical protein CFter6_0022 [Collimonas fungivorans]|uniref:Uncharacterized protein n=1 Tax=Collimonas fungivorans TaxID=158899 RepID=A0A127P4V7_9BURK|nr:hypothetical protein CFter6_0022 [Collimonas fungivorans]
MIGYIQYKYINLIVYKRSIKRFPLIFSIYMNGLQVFGTAYKKLVKPDIIYSIERL